MVVEKTSRKLKIQKQSEEKINNDIREKENAAINDIVLRDIYR